MIGAHPDDCDLRCSGIAAKYVRDGHEVRFLSVCDGSGGHMSMSREEIAARRRIEAAEAAAEIGVSYDCLDMPDCQLMPDLAARQLMIRYLRNFRPDAIFVHRTVDYHPDHRAAALLVQDATCLLSVPNECPDTPAMNFMPVMLYMEDRFSNPVFRPDIVIDIDDVIEKKFRMINHHVSQVYEWLPYTVCKSAAQECSEPVPEDPEKRFQWLHGDPITPETPDEDIIAGRLRGYNRRFALTAAKYRGELIERYGERGNSVCFAEAFQVSEYCAPLTDELKKVLFPY